MKAVLPNEIPLNYRWNPHFMEFVKPKLIVISAPSGSGKTSIFKRAQAILPNLFYSISHTTRQPREGEVDGVDYFFTDKHQFCLMIENNLFLEWAEVYGNFYGTTKEFIQRSQQEGKIVILDIDVQGMMQLKKIPDLDAVFVFITPPSLKALSDRLIERGTENEITLQRRLSTAEHEMTFMHQYDYQVINDKLDEAVEAFLRIIINECYDLKGDQEGEIDHLIKQLKKVNT